MTVATCAYLDSFCQLVAADCDCACLSLAAALLAAWEVTPADQSAYWAQVPDDVKLTLHYYNVPCSVEPDSEFNPLRIVRSLYQPGDFVVIKVCLHGDGSRVLSSAPVFAAAKGCCESATGKSVAGVRH